MAEGSQNSRGEQNKALVRRIYEEFFNQGDLTNLEEFIASDFVLHSPTLPEPGRTPEALREFVTGFRTGFPDVHLEIEDIFAEGDRVVARWRSTTQTQTGSYQGIPPTGRRVEMTGIQIYHFENGQIKEGWLEVDALRGLQQMGVVPPPGVGPFGLIGWAFKTVVRLGILQAKHGRKSKSGSGET